MTALIILGLLCAAVLYGIFFLIFKLVWLLFKNKRNLWPLVLSGAATAAVITLTVLATVHAVRTFVRPFNPIIEAAQNQTAPVYGVRPYVDTRYGFSLQLHNGTVMSDWIDWHSIAFLAGFDTNALLKTQDGNASFPLAAFGIIREEKSDNANAYEIMQEILNELNEGGGRRQVQVGDPVRQYVGPNADAYVISGTAYSASGQQGLPFYFMVAALGKTVYYIAGFGDTPDGEVADTVTSFRFANADRSYAAPALPAPEEAN